MELKAGLQTGCFRSSIFCGREELLLLQTLTCLTFKIIDILENKYKTQKEKKTRNMTPLKLGSTILES